MELILFLIIVASIGVFLIFRVFWLWYWKIDKIVELLESIDNKMGMETDRPEEQIMTV